MLKMQILLLKNFLKKTSKYVLWRNLIMKSFTYTITDSIGIYARLTGMLVKEAF